MSSQRDHEHTIISELAAIFRQAKDRRERETRIAMFESLSALEVRAERRGAPPDILARVAESRFLAGLLCDSVSPIRYEYFGSAKHLWTVAPDLQAPRDAIPV